MNIPPDTLANDVVVAAVSAALGGVLGAGAAECFAALNRSREQRERRAALAFGISDKASRMYSGCITVLRRYRRGTEEYHATRTQAAQRRPEPEVVRPLALSMFVRPRANTAARYDLTTDDLWALIQIGGPDLLNNFNGLDMRYNSFQNAVDAYAAQHQLVMAAFPIHDVDGTLVTARLDPGPDVNRLIAGMNALDEMIEETDRIASSLAQDLVTALQSLARARSRPLGTNYAIEMQAVDGTTFAVMARDPTHRRAAFPSLMTAR